jgi:hypothetical protein
MIIVMPLAPHAIELLNWQSATLQPWTGGTPALSLTAPVVNVSQAGCSAPTSTDGAQHSSRQLYEQSSARHVITRDSLICCMVTPPFDSDIRDYGVGNPV